MLSLGVHEMLPQLQKELQAQLGEECPELFKKVIDRTVSLMAVGHVRRMVAPIVVKMVGSNVLSQPSDALAALVQSALEVRLVDLT